MAQVISVAGRPPSESERTAFLQLGLTSGNWAALAAAPFYHRPGIRAPNIDQRGDALHLETLRRELRTVSGLSEETGRFWHRLLMSADPGPAELATRLLAWHLATDAPFAKRERVLALLGGAAGEFTTGAHARAAELLIEDVQLLVDCFLPCQTFPTDAGPRWAHIPPSSPDVLDALARACTSPACAWPPAPAPAQIPALVRLLGRPDDWWGKPNHGRRAAELGVAVLSFAERERLYAEAAAEWAALQAAGPNGAAAGRAFVAGIREWVDGARKAVRLNSQAPEAAKSSALPSGLSSRALLPTRTAAPAAAARPLGTVELTARATGKALRLGDGMRVGRSEYRDVLGLPDAGLAAADQFEIARDAPRNAWLVRPVPGARLPTWYQGTEVGAEGRDLAADSVISVGGKLELIVRFV